MPYHQKNVAYFWYVMSTHPSKTEREEGDTKLSNIQIPKILRPKTPLQTPSQILNTKYQIHLPCKGRRRRGWWGTGHNPVPPMLPAPTPSNIWSDILRYYEIWWDSRDLIRCHMIRSDMLRKVEILWRDLRDMIFR